jgi:hypothetical protein
VVINWVGVRERERRGSEEVESKRTKKIRRQRKSNAPRP